MTFKGPWYIFLVTGNPQKPLTAKVEKNCIHLRTASIATYPIPMHERQMALACSRTLDGSPTVIPIIKSRIKNPMSIKGAFLALNFFLMILFARVVSGLLTVVFHLAFCPGRVSRPR